MEEKTWTDKNEWSEAVSTEDYFRKAFENGKEEHPVVQRMRKFFPKTYEKVKEEFKK